MLSPLGKYLLQTESIARCGEPQAGIMFGGRQATGTFRDETVFITEVW